MSRSRPAPLILFRPACFSGRDGRAIRCSICPFVVSARCSFTSIPCINTCRLIFRRARISPPFGDPNQLTQVFLNLIVNAEQASRSSRQGSCGFAGPRRERVLITFQDDAWGFAGKRFRVSRSVFTTSGPGRGTGLGSALHGDYPRTQRDISRNPCPPVVRSSRFAARLHESGRLWTASFRSGTWNRRNFREPLVGRISDCGRRGKHRGWWEHSLGRPGCPGWRLLLRSCVELAREIRTTRSYAI